MATARGAEAPRAARMTLPSSWLTTAAIEGRESAAAIHTGNLAPAG